MIKALVGRTREQTEIERMLAGVSDGNAGLLLVSGEAGIGKTLLVSSMLEVSGPRSFAGRARESSNPPYGPLIPVLRACVKTLPPEEFARDPLSMHLGPLLPEIAALQASPERDLLVQAILSLITSVAARGPLVIFLDDLHWADNATLELLPTLVEALRTEPLLVIGTYRSDEIPRGHPLRRLRTELRRAGLLRELALSAMDERGVCDLIEEQLKDKPSRSFARLLMERTQGVPLYVEELVQALSERGLLEAGADGVALSPGETIPIPESIRDTVLLRLDHLSENAVTTLETAAVAGGEFSIELIEALCGERHELDELLNNQMLRETRDGALQFYHVLIREAVLSEIPWTRRRQLHREVADYLELRGASAGQIADHRLASREFDAARKALLQAADESCRIHAYRDAAQAAQRALEIWPANEREADRINALERMAHCAQMSGQLRDSARAWREALDSPLVQKNSQRRAHALRELATIYGLQGAWDHSVEAREAAAAALEEAGRPDDAAAELLIVSGRLTATLRYESAVTMLGRVEALAAQSDRKDLVARALGLKGNIFGMQGKPEAGMRDVQKALSIALDNDLTEAASEIYRRLASVLEYASDYSAAREAYVTAVNYCRAQGEDVYAQTCLGCMSYILFITGDWMRSIEVSRDLIRHKDTPGGSRAVGELTLGLIHAFRGETKSAKRRLATGRAAAREWNTASVELGVVWGEAVVADDAGSLDVAAHCYRRILEACAAIQERHDVLPLLTFAVIFFARNGMREETASCTQLLASIASVTGNPEALAGLAVALGESAMLNGDPREAADRHTRALQQIEPLSLPLMKCVIEFRAGQMHAAAKDRPAAVDLLRNAYRTARELGARPLMSKIASELESLNETVDERRGDGPARQARAGLTSRQLEVARELTSGLTNKEIASKLNLSPRTVDMHVANVLDRLGCRSRVEAVKKLSELGLIV